MENFQLLGSLALRLNQEFVGMYYVLLPVFFSLAIAIDWFRNPAGSPDFLETLKRAFIATLLVASFQEISQAILLITSGIADRISDMSGLDSILQMAKEKTRNYTLSTTSLVLGFNDLVVALLTFVSYIILYIARYIMVAVYHFMWIFLSIMAPLLMLFQLFRGTSQITANLFRSMIEVASYKIVWAVMSAMLTALSCGNAYATDGNYLTVILLNFVIAIAMLSTPLVVKSLVGGGLSGMANSLGMGAAIAVVSAPAKAATVIQAGREVISNTSRFAQHQGSQMSGHMPGLINTQVNSGSTQPPAPPSNK